MNMGEKIPLPPEKLARHRAADQRERERVAALIATDQQDRYEEEIALLDPDGERRLVRATPLIQARRAIAANGRSEAECVDTIGRLWSYDLLEGSRHAGDLLRDAGRRYAASYWRRYGNVCPHIGAYQDMVRKSRGIPTTFIRDDAEDIEQEERFRARDRALCDVRAKVVVDQVCVDGMGENDPGWLVDLMNGYPAQTRQIRVAIASTLAEIDMAAGAEAKEKLARRLGGQRRELRRLIAEERVRLLPHDTVALIRLGLTALADIDAKEGFHRPKRGPKPKPKD